MAQSPLAPMPERISIGVDEHNVRRWSPEPRRFRDQYVRADLYDDLLEHMQEQS